MNRILIVDDYDKTRTMLRRHLKKNKYEVIEAANGREALASLDINFPDVILLDVMMPDMTGFEVCKKIRSRVDGDLTYIIIVTGLTTDEEKIKGLDLGADDYMTKPFNVKEVLARIRVGIRAVERRKEAVFDPLTKLYNRQFFNRCLDREISRAIRYKRPLALIIMDIDHFKQINDKFGHLAGDKVLSEMGEIINQACRHSDLGVRWGGEEFIILQPETGPQGAAEFAERLRLTIQTHEFKGIPEVTASFGVAELEGDSPIVLIEHADEALYEAKENGRNQVGIWSK